MFVGAFVAHKRELKEHYFIQEYGGMDTLSFLSRALR